MSSVVREAEQRVPRSPGGAPESPVVTPRKARPVVWWAAVGAGAVALQAWIYGAWIASDDFRTVTIGRSGVPGHEKGGAWILQGLFTAAARAAGGVGHRPGRKR